MAFPGRTLMITRCTCSWLDLPWEWAAFLSQMCTVLQSACEISCDGRTRQGLGLASKWPILPQSSGIGIDQQRQNLFACEQNLQHAASSIRDSGWTSRHSCDLSKNKPMNGKQMICTIAGILQKCYKRQESSLWVICNRYQLVSYLFFTKKLAILKYNKFLFNYD